MSSGLVGGKLGEKAADTGTVDTPLPIVTGVEGCSAVLASGGEEELMCRGFSGMGAEAGFTEETTAGVETVSGLDLLTDGRASGVVSLGDIALSGLESFLCVSL